MVYEPRLLVDVSAPKKIFSPPPPPKTKNPQFAADTLPASPTPGTRPRCPHIFNKKPFPLPGASDSLFPLPEKKNIRNAPPTQRAQRSKKFEISIEIENFDREWNFWASHPPRPFFCGEIETSRLKISSEIKNFDRDWKFRSRSNFFDRWALWEGLLFFMAYEPRFLWHTNPNFLCHMKADLLGIGLVFKLLRSIGRNFGRHWVGHSGLKGAQTMKCKLWTETLEFPRLKVPNREGGNRDLVMGF